MGCSSWAESWVPCFPCNFWRAGWLRSTGEKLQAKAVPCRQDRACGTLGSHREDIHTPRRHGTAFQLLMDALIPSQAVAGCPAALPSHTTALHQSRGSTGSHQLFPWGPFVPRQCWITSAILASTSDCTALQKQTQEVSEWRAAELVCTMNVCTTQIHNTSELKDTHKTVPSSHRHLTFDLNSHSPGIDLIALWWRIPSPAHSEPGSHSVLSLSAWITHYATIPCHLAMTFYLRCPGLQKKRAFCTTEVSRILGGVSRKCTTSNVLTTPQIPSIMLQAISKSLLPMKDLWKSSGSTVQIRTI